MEVWIFHLCGLTSHWLNQITIMHTRFTLPWPHDTCSVTNWIIVCSTTFSHINYCRGHTTVSCNWTSEYKGKSELTTRYSRLSVKSILGSSGTGLCDHTRPGSTSLCDCVCRSIYLSVLYRWQPFLFCSLWQQLSCCVEHSQVRQV